VIAMIAPEVRQRGWYSFRAQLRLRGMWSYERDGLTIIYAENVLVLPDALGRRMLASGE
jgi:hypothetical protein